MTTMTEGLLDTSNMDAILHLYKDLINSDDHFVSIGGLQRNLHKLPSKSMAPSQHQVTGGVDNHGNGTMQSQSPQEDSSMTPSTDELVLTFDMLPQEMKLQIFSYLGAKDLSTCAHVSKHWQCLTSLDFLWCRLLMRDVDKWDTISHDTNPNLYKELDPHWTCKKIYRQCCPALQKPKSSGWNLNSLLSSFFHMNTPKIGIFGPGLESKTSKIITHILSDPTKVFKQNGVVPGSFSGVGSFFLMTISNLTFSLTVMYSCAKKDRERAARQGLQQLRHLPQSEHLKALCRSLDAFVFVVDATDMPSMQWAGTELFNMVNEKSSSSQTPVLVLCCVPEDSSEQVTSSSSSSTSSTSSSSSSTHTMTCFEVVNSLQLTKLIKPWRVCRCAIGNMDEYRKGFEWIINNCQ
ncbi:F-box only protein 4-like [Octopus sinensis]|uniref:F-box only protein 4-like n=1 Tax=Octopus sinensis TaxID=2607531 RepID=A0A6P7TUD2_9MOLL|nr:F-box only protein 4-like [Octopus sinensis]